MASEIATGLERLADVVAELEERGVRVSEADPTASDCEELHGRRSNVAKQRSALPDGLDACATCAPTGGDA